MSKSAPSTESNDEEERKTYERIILLWDIFSVVGVIVALLLVFKTDIGMSFSDAVKKVLM